MKETVETILDIADFNKMVKNNPGSCKLKGKLCLGGMEV